MLEVVCCLLSSPSVMTFEVGFVIELYLEFEGFACLEQCTCYISNKVVVALHFQFQALNLHVAIKDIKKDIKNSKDKEHIDLRDSAIAYVIGSSGEQLLYYWNSIMITNLLTTISKTLSYKHRRKASLQII